MVVSTYSKFYATFWNLASKSSKRVLCNHLEYPSLRSNECTTQYPLSIIEHSLLAGGDGGGFTQETDQHLVVF